MWGGFPSIAYKEEIDSGDIAMFIEDIYGLQIVLGEHLVTKKTCIYTPDMGYGLDKVSIQKQLHVIRS